MAKSGTTSRRVNHAKAQCQSLGLTFEFQGARLTISGHDKAWKAAIGGNGNNLTEFLEENLASGYRTSHPNPTDTKLTLNTWDEYWIIHRAMGLPNLYGNCPCCRKVDT